MTPHSMELPQIVEAVIAASEDPLDSAAIAETIRNSVAMRIADLAEGEQAPGEWAGFASVDAAEVEAAIAALNDAYQTGGRALAVIARPRGWQLMTRPEFADFLLALFPERRSQRLSAPALETLAIIAYRQPVTKAEIEAVRGVSADGMIQKLLDLELVKIGGRATVPGRPLQYVTTAKFLDHFNLRSTDDLPNVQELRRVNLPTVEEVHGSPPDMEAPAGESPSPESPGPGEPAHDASPAEGPEPTGDAPPADPPA